MSISFLISLALGLALLAISAGLVISLLKGDSVSDRPAPAKQSAVVAVSPFPGTEGKRQAAMLSVDLTVALASIDLALTVGPAGANTELVVNGTAGTAGKTIDIELRLSANNEGSQPPRIVAFDPGDPIEVRALASIIAGLLVGMRRLAIQPERFRSLLATLALAAAGSGSFQAAAVECLERIADTSVARDIRRDCFQALRRGIAMLAEPAARRSAELRFAALCLAEGITERQANPLWDAIDYCRRGPVAIDDAEGATVKRRLIEAEAYATLAALENESLHLVAARGPLQGVLAALPPSDPAAATAAKLLIDVELRRAADEIAEAPLAQARDELERIWAATENSGNASDRHALLVKLAEASLLLAERSGGIATAERALTDARRCVASATAIAGGEQLAEVAVVGHAEWLLGEATGKIEHFQSAVRSLGKAVMAAGITTDAPSVTSVLANVPPVPHLNGATVPLLETIRTVELQASELRRRLLADPANDDLRAEAINTLDTLKSYYQHLGFPVRGGAVAAEIARLERS